MKKLSKNQKIAIGVGVALGLLGLYFWNKYRLNRKNKKDCEKRGGIWNPKTKSCTFPEPEIQEAINEAIDNLEFEFNSDVIVSSSFDSLREVATSLNKFPNYNLELEGHTDSQGSDEYNLDLSNRRANSVKTFLISQGVADGRITAIGKGETEPIADNDTAEGRAQNRRVEFKLVDTSMTSSFVDANSDLGL